MSIHLEVRSYRGGDRHAHAFGQFLLPLQGAMRLDLDGRREVEMRLPGRYRLDGALRGALKSAPGVLMLEEA